MVITATIFWWKKLWLWRHKLPNARFFSELFQFMIIVFYIKIFYRNEHSVSFPLMYIKSGSYTFFKKVSFRPKVACAHLNIRNSKFFWPTRSQHDQFSLQPDRRYGLKKPLRFFGFNHDTLFLDLDGETMTLTPRQIEKIDDLDLHSRGNEKRRKYEDVMLDQSELEFFERDFESDFFDLEEETVLNPHEKSKVLLAQLVRIFKYFWNF